MKHFTRPSSRDQKFAPVPVSFEIGTKRYSANLIDADQQTLVLMTAGSHDISTDGFTADVVKLHVITKTLTLRHVVVLCTKRSPVESIVKLRVDDPAGKSHIWNLVYDLMFATAESDPTLPLEYFDIPLRGHYSEDKSSERRQWVENFASAQLNAIGDYNIDPMRLKGNLENFVGCVEVPVGLAGPLLFNGQYTQGYVVAPFATTEGALVASACRGAKALSKGGGVHTFTINRQMMRAPVFVTDSIADAHKLQRFILDHKMELISEMRLVSRRARLLDFETYQIGNALHMRFLYDTGDAAGQNMTTATTWKACQWILAQTSYYLGINIKQFMVEANMSGDKKVNYLSFISGRGIRVTAEAVISEEVLKSVLKVSSDELADATHIFMSGSLKAGMIGFNINIANTIAAIFVATGQDIACVHESSIGQLDIKKHGDGIYVSLLLPSLIIGTVGGGTGLPTQQDCLKIMGCQGTHKVNRLAEIIAGYCLALDLSTLAAIASGQFASAHEKLGRNHPEDGLKESHLTPEFFDTMLQNIPQFATVPGLHVTKLKSLSLDTQNSILSELTSTSLRKKVGHFAYDVHWEDLTTSGIRRIVIKAKPTDSEVINMVNSMAQGCGNKLARIYELFKKDTGFYKCHIREMEIYRLENEHVKRYMPEVFYTWRDDDHEIFAIAMEYLEDVLLKDTVMDIEAWSDEHIRAVLRDLAELHAVFLDQTEPLKTNDWMKPMSRDAMINMMPLWNEMLIHSSEEFPLLMPQERKELMSKIIDAIPEFWSTLEAAPWTLIHNDFNPRNICLRKTGKRFRLCAYDWELSTLNVPQHDLAEFLAFILPPGTSNERRLELIHYYREVLVEKTGKSMEAENFMKVYNAACFDFAVNRIQMYLMAHTFKDYQFLPRVLDSHFEYIKTIMR